MIDEARASAPSIDAPGDSPEATASPASKESQKDIAS